MTLYANHIAPFVATKLTLFGERLTLTPQLRAQVTTFSGYPGTADAFSHAYVRPNPRMSAALQARRARRRSRARSASTRSRPPPTSCRACSAIPISTRRPRYHYVAGVDVDVTPSLRIETDLFWKDMRDLIVRGEDPDGPVLVNDGLGRAYGGSCWCGSR